LETQRNYLEKNKYQASNGVVNLISDLNHLLQLYYSTNELEKIQNKTYINEQKKYKLGAASQLDIISAYRDFSETRVQGYQIEYSIYSNLLQLKYLTGQLPYEEPV